MQSMKTTDTPIVVETLIHKPKDYVWKAITEQFQMIKWFFPEIPEFKAEVGFQTQFDVETPDRTFPHVWTILEVVPEEKIVYDWRYKGYNGIQYVTFELLPKEEGTLVKLTSEVIEDFEEDVEEFQTENCLKGWKHFIEERLAEYLEQ